MINYYNYLLDNYVVKTKQRFYYYDVLIKNTNILKKDFFKMTKIPASSYIKAKNMEQQVGNQLTAKLANHFNIVPIDLIEVNGYEKLLSELITKINFNINSDYTKELETLEKLCGKETILKPIFMLFICFIKILDFSDDHKTLAKRAQKEYLYIKEYKDYFMPEFKILFFIIETLFERKIMKNMKEYLDTLKEAGYAHGMFYCSLSLKCYYDREFYDAIIYGRKAEEFFIKENNQNRLYGIRNNMSACYNRLERYAESIEICEANILPASIFYKDNSIYATMKAHYYTSLILSDRLDYAIAFINQLNTLNEYDCFYLAICYFKLKQRLDFLRAHKQYLEVEVHKGSFEHKILDHMISASNKKKCNVPVILYENFDPLLKKIIAEL